LNANFGEPQEMIRIAFKWIYILLSFARSSSHLSYITFLNARFDGKNGIMDKMIIARQNSQERIKEFSRVLGGKKRTKKRRKRLKMINLNKS